MSGQEEEKIAILVAGMHRSGTSVLTRVLNILGCDLPTTLVEPNPTNELGHWESRKIVFLNDEILASAGSSWRDWNSFNLQWYASPVAGRFRRRAQEALEDQFGDSPFFVLKDPRICRLLPFWVEAVRVYGAEPVIVSPIRNPLDIAASLEERDGIAPSIGHLLWLRHVLDAEKDTRGMKRAWLRYDALLSEATAVVDGIGDALGVSWPRSNSVDAWIEIDEFISPSIHHHWSSDARLLENPRLSHWIKFTFDIFNRWSRGDAHDKDIEELDRIRSAFDAASPAFSYALASSDQTLAERDERIEGLNQTLAERDERIEGLNQTLAERDERIENLYNSRSWRATAILRLPRRLWKIGELRQVVVERDARTEALHGSMRWRMTSMYRGVHRMQRALARKARGAISRTTRMLYRLAPLPMATKIRLKERLFRAAPWLFRRLLAYETRGLFLESVDVSRPADAPAPRYYPALRFELMDCTATADRLPILFDSTFYLRDNEDVRHDGVDPFEHYLTVGAIEGRMPVGDLRPDDLHPMIRDLHRLDPTSDAATAFDPVICRHMNSDASSHDYAKLVTDYERYGHTGSRSYSRQEFVNRLCSNPREIPLDFDPEEYVDMNMLDPHVFRNRPLDALVHYMNLGRWENRFYTRRMFDAFVSSEDTGTMLSAIQQASAAGRPPVCVLAHVYYPELWGVLSGYLGNLPDGAYDLYVNLVDTTFDVDLVSRIRDRFPSARIYVSENRGRDIGGYVRLLENICIDDYRIFCLIHSKKSPHVSEERSTAWRIALLDALMGTRDRAVENIALMLRDDQVGQIAAGTCRYRNIGRNSEKYQVLLDRMDIDIGARNVVCVSGTMMFLRVEVLRRVFEGIRDLPFEKNEILPNGVPYLDVRDGHWEHAVERIIGSVVRDMQYRFVWR